MTATSTLVAAHPNTAAHLPSVNFAAGASNFVEGILGQLKAGAEAIVNPAITSVTGEKGKGNFFGTLDDVKSAYSKISEIKSDFDKRDIQEGIADGVDLLKLTMAALSRFGIGYLPLTAVVSALPSIHSGGVDKV